MKALKDQFRVWTRQSKQAKKKNKKKQNEKLSTRDIEDLIEERRNIYIDITLLASTLSFHFY
ncbi:hypothetical protein [Bacillus sp. NPDC094077]|uniref:hypothetical protein n=1 Tax=Bacillus sp. NPDC094077 TaxID=3390932 RepID=UPI003D07D540